MQALRTTLLLSCLVSLTTAAKLSLLAIGDWGGESDQQPTTTAQIAASAGMATVAKKLSAEGILLLGDNFYTHGVQTNMSSRFTQTFEQVYPPTSFEQLPFYVIAGNHDHKGNVQAQIDYHDDSSRWHFPQLYYTLPFSFVSTTGVNRTVDIIMLDTVTLVGACQGEEDYTGCPLVLHPDKVDASTTQWLWLETQLTQSTADFLWVAGHYPIYSAGSDGTTPLLVSKLLPMLKRVNAHYISGHDHMHEHIVEDGVNMFVTGPGKFCCYDPIKINTVPLEAIQFMVSGKNGQGRSIGPKPVTNMTSGFSSMEFDDEVTITMYQQDGEVVWAPPSIPCRELTVQQEIVATATTTAGSVYTEPAIFERLSHFVDHGVPATTHDDFNRAMIADAACRTIASPFNGFALYHYPTLVNTVINTLSNLPSTASPSHFTLTSHQELSKVCPTASSIDLSNNTDYQCATRPLASLTNGLDDWHRALCANATDPSWKGKYDPAYQPQQIALTAGFMCIVTCDCSEQNLSRDTMAAFATNDAMAMDVRQNVCNVFPYPGIDFTKQATNAKELTTLLSPLRRVCGC